jgi:hypothetical protein
LVFPNFVFLGFWLIITAPETIGIAV